MAVTAATFPSQFNFTENEKTFLSGKGRGVPRESLGSLGIALTFSQENYWADSRWSAKGYQASSGTLVDTTNRYSPISAWKISPPEVAEDFSFYASGNDLFFKFPTVEDYTVYAISSVQTPPLNLRNKKNWAFGNTRIYELASIQASSVANDGYTLVPGAELHRQTEPLIFFHRLSRLSLSPETVVAPGISVVRDADTKFSRVTTFSIDVSAHGQPEDSNSSGKNVGYPYGAKPGITVIPDGNGGVRTIWKDSNAKQLFLTEIKADLTHRTIPLPHLLEKISNVVQDEKGNLFYVTYSEGVKPQIMLVKTSAEGVSLASRTQDPGDFDIRDLSKLWDSVRLCYADERVCVTYMRGMPSGNQGSIIVTYDADTLDLIRNYGQNSSHSFDSRLASDGLNFFNLSLGDNYPRGLAFDRVTPSEREGRVIYTYKTKHNSGGKTSNDFRTYTEIGDIVPDANGHGVVFTSEATPDNALAQEFINESRNLGYLLVSPRFHSLSQTEFIVPPEMILSSGSDSPLFGYYNFGGDYIRQQYRGVRWLTSYDDVENEHATRPKMVAIPGGKRFIAWEKWTSEEHRSTHGMIIGPKGNRFGSSVDLGTLRLSDGDSLAIDGSTLYSVIADGEALKLSVIEMELSSFLPIEVLSFDYLAEEKKVRIEFVSLPGETYALQATSSLSPSEWITLPRSEGIASSTLGNLEADVPVDQVTHFWRVVKMSPEEAAKN